MGNRMNKEELLELLKTLKIDKEEFWVLSSGALVLRGIYPDAGDLDIAVTDKGLEELKRNYNLKFKGEKWFTVSEQIEGICDGKKEELKYKPEKIGEYYVQNIQSYLEFISNSKREKDKERIPMVKKYIEEINKGNEI